MGNKETKTYKELKAEIEELNARLNEKQVDKEELEADLNDIEYNINSLEADIEENEKIMYKKYPISFFITDIRQDLQGQFERNGKWYVCDGYSLIENDNKFEEIPKVAGINITIEQFFKGESFSILPNAISDYLVTKNDKIATINLMADGRYDFNGFLFASYRLDKIIEVTGKENIESLTVYKESSSYGVLHIKAKNMQAILLGIRNLEK